LGFIRIAGMFVGTSDSFRAKHDGLMKSADKFFGQVAESVANIVGLQAYTVLSEAVDELTKAVQDEGRSRISDLRGPMLKKHAELMKDQSCVLARGTADKITVSKLLDAAPRRNSRAGFMIVY
jgi:hypothetical protein